MSSLCLLLLTLLLEMWPPSEIKKRDQKERAKREIKRDQKYRILFLKQRQGIKLKRGLAIAGFMGSGKTTLARHFAEQVGAPCLDLDDLVERSLEMSIEQIFECKGEEEFRKAEYAQLVCLQERKDEPYVLALGGGSP